MDYTLMVTVDTNDGDYVTENKKISEGQLPFIREICNKIKNFSPYVVSLNSHGNIIEWKHRHNWPNGECLREDLGEKSPIEIYGIAKDEFWAFQELLPYCEYGFHTIVSVEIVPWTEPERIL